ncbi:MAG: cation-translocating P-type ATPase [Firmicutes bacterium]|nr:cation-translocating P-type ATPase [Bacillota bacterium]
MLKKIVDYLAGTPMTIVSGICLVISLALNLITAGFHSMTHLQLSELSEAEYTLGNAIAHAQLPFDPAWISVIISGIPLLYLAIYRLIYNKGISKISSCLLISIAMFAAIAIGDFFAAGEVAFIMAIGAILEEKTTERARKGLKKLISLTPRQGRRVVDGAEEMIPAEEISVGDVLRILPGENIPVDGVILCGETSVDQSIMTGESIPVDKEVGDEVFCGTINCFGTIDIRAVKVGEDGSLQQLIRMVQEAEDKKAPMQRLADRWASWLVPVALLLAIVAGLIKSSIVVTVTILVVFCPCALVLATPTAIMAAIGQATKHGVIIKSGEALEKMAKVDTIAFDKTGTLTFGNLEVSDVISFDPCRNETDFFTMVASAEARSEHPLGKAIVAKAKEDGLALVDVADFRMDAGKGIYADVKGTALICGNEKYLGEKGISLSEEIVGQMAALRDQGKAIVLAATEGICIGLIALSDTIRPDAAGIIAKLTAQKVETVLLTGDNQKAAAYFSQQAGITTVYADLLPEEKVGNLEKLKESGCYTCMIGDGVNDAPALKTAEVGVAMANMGSDIAVEAADIALISDNISKVPYLKRLANAATNTIRFGITLSLCINAVAIVLSFMGALNPTTGALVHNCGSCLVVLIAALLYDRKFEE